MLKRFYTAIVHRRRAVLAAFVLAAVLSVFASRAVQVDYDINDYLPPDSPSTLALEQMNSAFTGGIPNMRVMVRDVTVPEALDYKEKLAAIDGVEAVTWLDDSLDVTVPLQMQDTATVETYYKDNCALFTVTVEDAKRLEAVAAIQDLIGEDNALAGTAVSTAVATNSTVTEVAKIAAIAVVYVLFILILTTDSWVEPLLVLAGLGAAILINNGTNLMFGTISFVTNAAGSILQLAVSLDYSVFLIHRFAECRAARPDASAEDCMVEALCKSTGSILSSGLTTVIGFLALVLMQFQIGPDLGLALAKGVVLSLVTVFTFMPALTLVCYPWMDKTHHKPLLPGFDKFGRFVSRIMLPAALALAVIMVPSYLASNNNEYYYGAARHRRHRRDIRQERYLGGAGAGGRHRHPGRAFGCAARHPGGDGHPVLCGQRGRVHPAGVRAPGHPETAGVRRLHPHGAHRERRHRGRRGLCTGGKSACHGAAVLPGCV